MKNAVVGATLTEKVPVATSLLASSTWQVTVLEKSGKLDPDAGVQLPGVAAGRGVGVVHVATAPAWLVAVTVWFEGTRMVPVTLAPVSVAPATSRPMVELPYRSWCW